MSLGRCCICQTYYGVTNIMMLERRAPVPGTGWGCVLCGLPNDGAAAVVCDGCMDFIEAGGKPIFVCSGPPSADCRILFSELSSEPFRHNEQVHRREEGP